MTPPGIATGQKAVPELVSGQFQVRLNRFAALVDIDGQSTQVHVANSGRMKELLVPGYRVWLRHQPDGANRKTSYDLALVEVGDTLVSADARLPNRLVLCAFQHGRLPQFNPFDHARGEVTYGDSRLDMVLTGPEGKCYVEAKSVTLVVDGAGLFPDAPTERGRKHVLELARAVDQGHRAAVIFVVQRGDVERFTPNDEADPAFGAALRQAVHAGVEAYAYSCQVSLWGVCLGQPLPVEL